jgi:hypothetical protein
MTDEMSQTQLVRALFYLQGVISKLQLVNKIIHAPVVFDSFYLSFIIVSDTTGMAQLKTAMLDEG